MVRFQSMYKDGKEINAVIIDGVKRFSCEQNMAFMGGWVLYTLEGIKIKHFPTLEEVETYVEEMDK